jgi:CDP-glucose 4,6-dehydratase
MASLVMTATVRDPQFWRDRRVFVTGATGLVGSWLVSRLDEAGAELVCLVRDWVPASRFVRAGLNDRVTLVRGDVRDQPMIERILGEYEIDIVIHLAAQTIVGIANRNPISTFETNITGTWALLEAIRRSPTVRAVVIASSDKAYGTSPTLPYTEATPLAGNHPYDVSKSCADLIAQSYAKTWNVPVAITRCGNFFGGGDLIRDYVYVEDAVECYLLLAERLRGDIKLAGEAFNFSTDDPRSVLAIVALIQGQMGSNLEPRILDEASNEIRAQHLDSTKARDMLGWKARYGLADGLARSISWYRDYFGARQ